MRDPRSRSGMNAAPTAAQMEDADRLMREYGGRSEDELMKELLSATGKQKAEGSFDAEGMRRTAELLMPMLTPEQAEKLMRIMDMIG